LVITLHPVRGTSLIVEQNGEFKERWEHRVLELKVGFSKWVLVTTFVSIMAIYVACFGRNGLSEDPGAWGQFGDFVGGILNPLVAFFAFYWLATSVILQKSELADSRRALVASQRAQQLQANTALATAKIQTLNIKLQSVATQLNQARQQLGELLHFQGVNGPGRIYFDENGSATSPQQVINGLRTYIADLIDKEANLIAGIEHLSAELTHNNE